MAKRITQKLIVSSLDIELKFMSHQTQKLVLNSVNETWIFRVVWPRRSILHQRSNKERVLNFQCGTALKFQRIFINKSQHSHQLTADVVQVIPERQSPIKNYAQIFKLVKELQNSSATLTSSLKITTLWYCKQTARTAKYNVHTY